MMKKHLALIIPLLIIVGSFSVWNLVLAVPPANPPQNNKDYPLNLSVESQTKEGALILNTGDSVNGISPAPVGFILSQGKMGVSVGTGANAVNPDLRSEVAGKLGADKFCNRDGSNCISIDQANLVEPPIPSDFIPSGAIFMFVGNCPSGYQYFAAIENRFPRGTPAGESVGGTGGTSEHSHSLPRYTNSLHGPRGGEDNALPRAYLQNASNLPPYVNVVFCKKS